MRASHSFAAAFTLALALGVGISSSPCRAVADDSSDPNSAEADQLFNEGRDLMAKGDYANACPKFEQSHKLRPGIGTLFNLADCHEKVGKLVDAYNEFQEVVERTKAALQPDRQKIAEDRVASLERRLSKLVITIPSTTMRVTVALDNVTLTPDHINVPLIVTAGEHDIRATTDRDNGEPFDTTVNLAGNGATTTVTIPVAPGAKMKRNTGLMVAGGVLLGVGILGLVGGAAVAVDGSLNGSPDETTAGGVVALVGIVSMCVGIPLLVVGAKKHPVASAQAYVIEPSPIPDIRIGAGMATATWHF